MQRQFLSIAFCMLLMSFVGCARKPDEFHPENSASGLPTGIAATGTDDLKDETEFVVRDVSNPDIAFLVRLDSEHLRSYNLSKSDVMEAVTQTRSVGPNEPPPAVDVVYNQIHDGLGQNLDNYLETLLRASPAGEVVRLKDVATIELLTRSEPKEDANAETGGRRQLGPRKAVTHSAPKN